MSYDITGNDVEILPYQFREITGAFAPLASRTYAAPAPRVIAASAVNPVHVAAIRAAAPAYRAPVPQAPPINPIRIAAIAIPPVMHTDSLNMGGFPGGGGGGAPRVASIVQSFQRSMQPNIGRTASQALRDYQASVAKKSAFGMRGGSSFIASNAPQPQSPQPAAPTTSADVPLGANDAFQGQGDLPAPPPPVQVGPMTDGSQQPVYGYDGGNAPPNPYGYGGGWDSGYPQSQGQYQGGGGGGGGGNPYADQGEPPWGYAPDAPQDQTPYAGPAYGGSPDDGGGYPDYGPDYGSDYGTDYGYQDDNAAPPSDGTDWGSDYVDDTMAASYTNDSDLAYQDLDSQYGGGLDNG